MRNSCVISFSSASGNHSFFGCCAPCVSCASQATRRITQQHAGRSTSSTLWYATHIALTNINFSTTRTCYLTSSTCLIFIVSKRMSLNEEFNPISTHKARVSWGDMDANAHVNNLMFFSKPISTFIAINNLTCHSEWTQDARADFLMYKSMSSSPPPICLRPCPPNSFSSPPSPRLTF